MAETTPGEAALKTIGFQAVCVADVQGATGIYQQAKKFYSRKVAETRARWANKARFVRDLLIRSSGAAQLIGVTGV